MLGYNHHTDQHPSTKSSTGFSWNKGGKFTAAGWQVTLFDPTWHVISLSGVVISTNCCINLPRLLGNFSDPAFRSCSFNDSDREKTSECF